MKRMIALMILVSLLLITGCGDSIYDEFAKCLAQEGMTFYGTFWCSHCASMKNKFGDSFKYVVYVECDPRGQNPQPDLCRENAIEVYPTFEFKSGARLTGEQDFEDFAHMTDCALPEQDE